MGIATVITSGKGGVGKSTMTVALGMALTARERRVLLVDCDAGLRSLDRMTGVESSLVYDVADIIYGRCSPSDAIYSCGGGSLFLLPAPSIDEKTVSSGVMKKLVDLLKQYYDHVILDSPAGIGSGFKAAVNSADRALVVCNADPVSTKAAWAVNELLKKRGLENRRLIINRFDEEIFAAIGSYCDLDEVIDAAGVRLIGVVPQDYALSGALLNGRAAKEGTPGMMALCRIAARLEGEIIPVKL